MKPITREWLAKADADWDAAQREYRADGSNYDLVCFLAQQCAEKYLKAVLQEESIPFPRTHDLTRLLALVDPPIERLNSLQSALAHLTELAVDTRYPGFFANAPISQDALATAKKVRRCCREKFGLPIHE